MIFLLLSKSSQRTTLMHDIISTNPHFLALYAMFATSTNFLALTTKSRIDDQNSPVPDKRRGLFFLRDN